MHSDNVMLTFPFCLLVNLVINKQIITVSRGHRGVMDPDVWMKIWEKRYMSLILEPYWAIDYVSNSSNHGDVLAIIRHGGKAKFRKGSPSVVDLRKLKVTMN